VVLLGKSLQVIAMTLLPISIFLEMSKTLGRNFFVADLLLMMIFGIILFFTGRMFEGYGRTGGE
jgi:hypothetical protein